MAVSIDATNLVTISAAESATGWTSSLGGLNTTAVGAREGTNALQDQASQQAFNIYFGITSADYSARTIFGWIKQADPGTEGDANGAGFALYLGDGTWQQAVKLNPGSYIIQFFKQGVAGPDAYALEVT